MMELAGILRAARLAAGLTQRQVADALGLPHTYPSRWERGAVRPRPANLLGLADLYGLDAGALLRLYAAPAEVEPAAAPPADDGAAAAAALSRAVTDAAGGGGAIPRRRAAAGSADAPGRRRS
jgi:transcriptional regulator with XRE-family HTH domain